MFGILATIIAAVKGHKSFAWFTGIWTVLAIIIALSGGAQYAIAPGGLFFIIALTMKNENNENKEPSPTQSTAPVDNSKKFVCKSCGQYSTGWYQTCPHCGATGKMENAHATSSSKATKAIPEKKEEPQSITQQANKFVCKKCGGYSTGWYQTCPRCGAVGKMEKASPAQIVLATSEKEPSVLTQTATPPMLFCRKCGARLIPNTKYCAECGAEIIAVIPSTKYKDNAVVSPVIEDNEATVAVAARQLDHAGDDNGDDANKIDQAEPRYVPPSRKNVIHSKREIKTKGVPADYFFPGDATHEAETLSLLSPLTVDVENAAKHGIQGLKNWDMENHCKIIGENQEYIFYNYRCYPDGSGGCNIRQSKDNPKDTVFFGRARTKTVVFHNYLVQVNNSVYGDEFYVYTKEIHTGQERMYRWFGRYSIPTNRGSRYDQDNVVGMYIDEASDTIRIDVHRRKFTLEEGLFYVNLPLPSDEDDYVNADTDYTLIIQYYNDDFHAIADYPDLDVTQVFENEY